jgi:antitoxin component of MazEF toxin-antitoxin module
MATLQTRISRRLGEKTYLKSSLTIPRNFVEELGWKDDQELEFQRVDENGLMLTPTQPKLKASSPTFESFAEAVERALAEAPQGLTWSQIRETTGLPCKKPNPLWVHRLENERGLKRFRDSKTSQIIWKLG